MPNNLIKRAAILGAAAFAFAPAALRADWTSFTAGLLNSYSFTHAHHPDGRFIFGAGGVISLQNDFSLPDFTAFANGNNAVFDPSFIAVRSASSGIVGGGGFFGPSGLFPFDPSATAADISTIPLAVMQNYAAVWWQHPISGRQGWLVLGGNAAGNASNIVFASADGAATGPITNALSSYSGGLAADTNGNVFVALADFNPAIDNQVLRFSADQIDAAVLAILDGTPAPLADTSAVHVFHATTSSSLAVDSAGRLWLGGYQIDYLQAHDPVSGITRRFHPLSDTPAGYAGSVNYSPRAFSQGGLDRVSFLANDSFYTFGTDLFLGHAEVNELEVRSVQFTTASRAVNEDSGSVLIEVSITPAPTEVVTVPLSYSGTATSGGDFGTPPAEVVFTAGQTTQEIQIDLFDDADVGEPDETLVITLGNPAPANHAGLGAPATEHFTLVIEDNEVPPAIVREQNFAPLQVGASFFHQMTATHGDATRWSAKGLPPGLSIDPLTGIISGTPTSAGEFDRVIVTARNEHGSTTSIVFLLPVASLPELVAGSFSALVERDDTATDGLGAKFDLTTTASASFTAKLRLGKKTASARGTLDASSSNPVGTAVFKISGVQHFVEFEIDGMTGILNGQLVNGGLLTGFRHSAAPERTGLCNFSLFQSGSAPDSEPQGAGTGSLTLPARGNARAALRLPDNTAFTNSGALGPNGEFILYQALYKQPGSLCGQLEVANDLELSVTGNASWSKPSQPGGPLYRNGWSSPILLNARGGKYRAPMGATLPLDILPSVNDNAMLVLQDGGIDDFGANPVETPLRIVSISKRVLPAGLKLTINARNGAIGGSLRLGTGSNARTATLRGLLVPDETTANGFDSTGQGFFILPTTTPKESRSGLLLLEPLP